jgi:hypothetical protein
MRLSQFRELLSEFPDGSLRFVLPDGTPIPAHAHVTEVARVAKRFVDCGGTLRDETTCRLQVWVAEDIDHRLTPGKLDGVLGKAAGPVLENEDLAVEIEYEAPLISQFAVLEADIIGNTILFRTGHKHTDCLAKELCLPTPGGGKCC